MSRIPVTSSGFISIRRRATDSRASSGAGAAASAIQRAARHDDLLPDDFPIKGYPFEVIDEDDPPSVVLADQVESVHWRARRVDRKGCAASTTLAEVRAKVGALLEL